MDALLRQMESDAQQRPVQPRPPDLHRPRPRRHRTPVRPPLRRPGGSACGGEGPKSSPHPTSRQRLTDPRPTADHTGKSRCPRQQWIPACERVKKYEMRSFRGAGTAREPGTQAHGVLRYRQGAVFIGSGPAKGRPGMTTSQLSQFLHTLPRRESDNGISPEWSHRGRSPQPDIVPGVHTTGERPPSTLIAQPVT